MATANDTRSGDDCYNQNDDDDDDVDDGICASTVTKIATVSEHVFPREHDLDVSFCRENRGKHAMQAIHIDGEEKQFRYNRGTTDNSCPGCYLSLQVLSLCR